MCCQVLKVRIVNFFVGCFVFSAYALLGELAWQATYRNKILVLLLREDRMGWFSTLGSSLNLACLSCASPTPQMSCASSWVCPSINFPAHYAGVRYIFPYVCYPCRKGRIIEQIHGKFVRGKTLLKSILLISQKKNLFFYVRYSIVFAVRLCCAKICFNLLFYFLLNVCRLPAF